MVAIVDYGMGNLASVQNAFVKTGGEETLVTADPAVVRRADRLVVPGVGAFEDAMKALRAQGLSEAILDFIRTGRPFLGICLGMHLLFERSYENGVFEGLGVIKGEVVRFRTDLPVPHMGWNEARMTEGASSGGLFDELPRNAYFYFDHSYYPVPADSRTVMSTTDYGQEYASAVLRDNVCAVQYHPEKSHRNGLKLIKSFLEWR